MASPSSYSHIGIRLSAPQSEHLCLLASRKESKVFLFAINFGVWVFLKHFFNIFFFLLETECESGRGRESEIQNPKQASGSELSSESLTLGLEPTNCEIKT